MSHSETIPPYFCEISHAPIRKPCLSCELTQNNLIPYPFHRGNGSLPHLISDEGEVV